jgi:putative resolvase
MKLIKIGKVAEKFGVHPDTIRDWEVKGELLPFRRSMGGTRFYREQDIDAILGIEPESGEVKP